MALSRTVSEINGDFSRKSQILPTYQKNYSDAAARWFKKFADMCIRVDTIPQCHGQTDRQKW